MIFSYLETAALSLPLYSSILHRHKKAISTLSCEVSQVQFGEKDVIREIHQIG